MGKNEDDEDSMSDGKEIYDEDGDYEYEYPCTEEDKRKSAESTEAEVNGCSARNINSVLNDCKVFKIEELHKDLFGAVEVIQAVNAVKNYPKIREGSCYWEEPVLTSLERLDDSNSNNAQMAPFLNFCQSYAFVEYIRDCGLDGAKFTVNPHISSRSGVRAQAFEQACRAMGSTSSHNIRLVFHGTPKENIDNILYHGLDKNRRRGQACGLGEYFSKDPVISVSYCKGNCRMLVFCVIMPKASEMSRAAPKDYVVVENNANQIPIGYFDWGFTGPLEMKKSTGMRTQLEMLNQELADSVSNLKDANAKSLIIQCLIQNKVDLAVEKYHKYKSDLLHLESRREISTWAYQMIDPEVVPALFGDDFPPPLSREECDKQATLVDSMRDTALKALQDFRDAQVS